MKKISIQFEFSGGKGKAHVKIIPSNYGIYKQDFSGVHDFTLPAGDYMVIIDGVSPPGGTSITLNVDAQASQSAKINDARHFSEAFSFNLA